MRSAFFADTRSSGRPGFRMDSILTAALPASEGVRSAASGAGLTNATASPAMTRERRIFMVGLPSNPRILLLQHGHRIDPANLARREPGGESCGRQKQRGHTGEQG